MRINLHNAAATVVVLVVVCELMLIVGSWLGSAMFVPGNITSLLSAEGVRWYIGSFASILATPYLIWILLAGIVYGIIQQSAIVLAIRRQIKREKMEFIDRLSLNVAEILCCVLVAIVLFMTVAPHALLLSATGTILDSSFSSGIVPILSFVLVMPSLAYGLCASKFKTITSVFDAMTKGVTKMVPVIILYLFVTHLIITVQYIF